MEHILKGYVMVQEFIAQIKQMLKQQWLNKVQM